MLQRIILYFQETNVYKYVLLLTVHLVLWMPLVRVIIVQMVMQIPLLIAINNVVLLVQLALILSFHVLLAF